MEPDRWAEGLNSCGNVLYDGAYSRGENYEGRKGTQLKQKHEGKKSVSTPDYPIDRGKKKERELNRKHNRMQKRYGQGSGGKQCEMALRRRSFRKNAKLRLGTMQ